MKGAAAFLLVACLTGSATYFGAASLRADAKQPLRYALVADATPSAGDFGRALAGTANQYGGDAKIAQTHCVQAKPGRYMCSYAVVRRGHSECHLMQGRWTPNAESTITVTLAGRAARCRSLRDAIQSLD